MAFPEFESGKRRILFFSRGRGRGHAVSDIAIYRALQAIRDDIDVRFVSYGTGGDTLQRAEVSFIDLGLPDTGGIVNTSVLAGKLIRWLNPDVVLSHEEFPAIPAAKIFDKPTVALTDWFLDAEGYAMNSLSYADHILFLGPGGVFDEPPALKDRVTYMGPMARNFSYGRADREKARRDLDITPGTFVLSVFPGSWSEARTPIHLQVLGAFNALSGPKRLFWITGTDHTVLTEATRGEASVTLYQHYEHIDRLMVATDVAITKTNRKAVFELQYLGIPAIAITFGLNPADDIAVSSLQDVVFMQGRELAEKDLSAAISALSKEARSAPPGMTFCTPADCASILSKAVGPTG